MYVLTSSRLYTFRLCPWLVQCKGDILLDLDSSDSNSHIDGVELVGVELHQHELPSLSHEMPDK